jgi:hypothetical protein
LKKPSREVCPAEAKLTDAPKIFSPACMLLQEFPKFKLIEETPKLFSFRSAVKKMSTGIDDLSSGIVYQF